MKKNPRAAVMAGAAKHSQIVKAKKAKDAGYAKRLEHAQVALEVAEQLHKIREDRGLTQRQLGDKVGMKQQAIARIEKGQNLTLRTVQTLAQAMGYRVRISFPASVGRRGRAGGNSPESGGFWRHPVEHQRRRASPDENRPDPLGRPRSARDDFQSCAFDHSATFPQREIRSTAARAACI
jgi:transcriptional regulator with XRE-family HTH domain